MENINVFIRLKPTPPSSHDTNFTITTPTTLYNTKTKETFTFDHIIPQTTSNEAIFTSLIKDTLSFLLNGINVSIFAYGQTSTGKTYTMKGDNINNGIIPLSIKNIFTRLQEASIIKHSIKVSYAEIYNETVNDLLNTSKRNLEIRESVAKGVFVNNLTEIVVDDYDKVIKILNTGESNRKIAETKLNEKSSRSHTIFKIYIEFNRKDTTTTTESNVVKTYSAQLNLIDLAGSENVSKAKCEGIRLKEGTNINKSLLALSNVINRLSQNSKHFINYRDSKLTRLLQTSLGGNSKTTVICTIVDDNMHYSETVNTLHFGLKAKNVKTTVRINEVIDDKGKIILENNQLKSKIKMLQELINEKKEKRNKCITNKSSNSNNSSSNNNISTVNKVYSSSNCKISSKNLSSLLCTADKRSNNVLNTSIDGNEQINALEKEVALLKRLLINNKEEVGEDVLNNSVNNDLYSINSNNNVYHSLTQSAYKASNTYNNNSSRLTNINQFQESSAMKSPFNPYLPLYPNDNNNTLQEPPSSAYRRTCMTELRGYTQYNYVNTNTTTTNNNAYFQNSSLHKTASKIYTNNALCLSAFHNNSTTTNNNNQNEFEYHSTGMNNDLYKENEDLRRSLYEMRKTYYEVVQSKENQIKLLNQNHSMTLENCEKLIKEAEDNFLNLKLNYDQAQEQLKLKDNEISELNNKNMNLESMVNYYKDEIAKLKEFNVDEDMERKYKELSVENEKLKEELSLIKSTLQLKENECVNVKEQLQSLSVDIMKLKNEIKTLKTNKGINDNNKLIIDYENKVTQLEKENNEYKNSLQLIKETQIVEYQQLLDESFDKIKELNNELYHSKEKINFLEKAFAIIETTNVNANTNASSSKDISICEFKHPNNDKEDIQYTPQHNSNNNNNESNDVNGSNKSTNTKLLSKKRKILPKIYHGIIDKQHSSKTPKQLSNISSTKENINAANITNTTTTSSINEISNFQI